MKKTLLKNSLRNIRQYRVSWLAISIVVMLCCGVYYGTSFFAASMENKIYDYAKVRNKEDLGIVAPAGLKEDEIQELKKAERILDAEGTWYIPDSGLTFKEQESNVSIYGLTDRLSTAKVLQGTLPEKDGQCALSEPLMKSLGIVTGDVVRLSCGSDMPDQFLKSEFFTVTAMIDHPDNISRKFGDLVFLDKSAFDKEEILDCYTYIRLSTDLPFDKSVGLDGYTASLNTLRDEVRDVLTPIGRSHDIRIKAEANQELADAKKEADEKLANARKDIKKAEKDIKKAHKKIQDADKKVADAEDEIADGEKKIADGEKEITRNEKKLKKAEKQIKAGRKKLNSAEKQLKPAKKKLDKAKKKYNKEKGKLDGPKKELNKAEKELHQKKAALDKLKKAGLPIPDNTEAQLRAAEKKLKSQKEKYNAASIKLDAGHKELASSEREYNHAKQKLESGKKELRSKERQLRHGKKELKKAKKTLADKKQELADAKEELEDKKKELADKKQELADAEAELADGKEEYHDKKQEADEKIADAQQKIDDLASSSYVFVTRNDQEGYTILKLVITAARSLGLIFVIIFLLVGIIVILSTITILIDADKKRIGTMKSFGFKDSEIISGYMLFSLSATLFGIVLSIPLTAFIQWVIVGQLGPISVIRPDRFSFNMKIFAILLAVQMVLSAVFSAAGTILNATRFPAVSLLDGTAGKKQITGTAGKSRGGSLYSRLIFRNMLIDRGRVITSIIVIAGSCLMMGAGLTLKSSFTRMMPQSAAEITHYDVEMRLTDRCADGDYGKIESYLKEKGLDYAAIRKFNTVYHYGDTEEFLSVITGSPDIFPEYLEITDLAGKSSYNPDRDGLLICNRISERTGLKPGDDLVLYDEDYHPHEIKAGGICKNYFGRVMYLSKNRYEEITGKKEENNTFLVRVAHDRRDALRDDIQSRFTGLAIEYTDDLPKTYSVFKDIYNAIVYLMVGLSIIMAVFVLLNLVNIFVSRRKNEIIIMAVNGFSHKMQISYLLKEAVLTTTTGLVLGVTTGFFMTDFLIRTIEGNDIMQVRSFDPVSWVIAVLLELTFALLIYLISFRKLRKLKLTDISK